MANERLEKVQASYKRELAALLCFEVGDPLLKKVVVSRVVFTPDLSLAKVYFYCENEVREREIVKGFLRCRGFLRSALAKKVVLKFTPDLKFYWDKETEHKEHMDRLFENLK